MKVEKKVIEIPYKMATVIPNLYKLRINLT